MAVQPRGRHFTDAANSVSLILRKLVCIECILDVMKKFKKFK